MSSLGRLLPFVRPYRRRAALAMLLLIVVVAADLAIPRLVQRVIDVGIANRDLGAVASTALVMFGASLLSAAMAVVNTILSVKVAQFTGADLRDALFAKIQSLSFRNLDDLQTGRLLVRLTSDVNQVQLVTLLSLRLLLRGPLMLVGSVVLMVMTSPALAAWMLLVLPVTAGTIVIFAARAPELFRRVQRRLDRLNAVLQENLAGIRVVKAFVRQDHESTRFGEANAALAQQSIVAMRLLSLLIPTMSLFINGGTMLVLWVGGGQVEAGAMSVGEIVAFVNYLLTTMFPLMLLGMMSGQIFAASASADRIIEVLDAVPDVRERPDAIPLDGRPSDGGARIHSNVISSATRGARVAFEDVSFGYDGHEEDGDLQTGVLKSISLVAEPGEQVAVLGATGSGKSTLIHLIPRFYDVHSGRVTIDGIDVRDLELRSLRSQVGVALQEAILFTGTVRDNIRYGRPSATEDEVIEAAKAAQAHDFITALPNGYDTMVGQRGVNLSGGQKQRVSIARALLVRPRVLILDDSTSAVDFETESRIQAALEVLLRTTSHSTTIFCVAQRISTVLGADKIIVLEDGGIAAVGTHEHLLASSLIYREIYASQLGDGPANSQHSRGESADGE